MVGVLAWLLFSLVCVVATGIQAMFGGLVLRMLGNLFLR
jgi:hypothetical protein